MKTITGMTGLLQHHLNDGHLKLQENAIYEIDKTLQTPSPKSGVKIEGQGIVSITDDRFSTENGTILRCAPGFKGPILEINSSEVKIDGIVFDGGRDGEVGIHIKKRGVQKTGSYNPGKIYDSHARFENFSRTAIEVGTEDQGRGWHCDEVRFDWAQFDYCERCIIVNNEQSMVHKFDNLHVKHCNCFAEYRAGGCLIVNQATILHGLDFLRFTDHPLNNGSIGSSNGQFTVRNIKADAQSVGQLRLVNCEKMLGNSVQITFDSVRIPTAGGNLPTNLFHLSGGVVLNLYNFFGLSNNIITSTPQPNRGETPLVNMFGTRIHGENWKDPTIGSPFDPTFKGSARTIGCYSWPRDKNKGWVFNRPLPDEIHVFE